MTDRFPLLQPDEFDEPASEADLSRAESALGVSFPPGYRDFLLSSDGYGGPVGDGGFDVYLWAVDEVADGGYGGPEEAGVTLIGSNGGPTGYGFLHGETDRFVSIPLASSDPADIRPLGASFEEFLRAVADGDGY